MIKLQHISKIFEHNKTSIHALKDITIHVPQGKIYGVIGKSGAGKSTLIRCVNLLEKPTSGKIFFDNQEITHLSNRKLIEVRRKISMIFQHFNLLSSRTVFDNIAFPLELNKTPKAKIKQKVNELIELVGLTEKADVYPANLSGGQKQRVAIARALASDPKVLLCDEATSALDPETTRSILKLLKDINQKLGLTILLITHEMDVVKQICDQVAVISNGELVEQSSVGEIFSHAKTDIARQFIQSTLHLNIPDDYLARLSQEPKEDLNPLVRLEFTGVSVDLPLLSQIAKEFNIESNIISAQMDYAGGVKFGLMLAQMDGNPKSISSAIQFLENNNTKVEVLGYV
ncbi:MULTISPECIES: methionine ABC transporter ATP-binding protein MetN [unclassified Gilliamella]|uniref:methionine ABC transporter ATP-binding protein MetN n=1 Tax=unclassified Gilliamella TaxID=2685620 RepID=UPI0013094D1D|nr:MULTISPECIES: methionine ABC transporter ATP-binding protein MetN [unclassified Gilliamella]MWP50151.1 methionine ABC transporter ATP-binding protein MetN [Gilliamella sp. Lep-s35]MWP69863.1 methionine ABC transporter ATP-binding protein MetN [Gilliamella sp. Lep-s5]MWP78174.1 methionine ABC transporter ATP-binding protein MetN [Gilliamella sp. Lep-s21]